MQEYFFHVCPILLSPGSIIEPGNFGRIINQYVLGKTNFSMYFREVTLENIRNTHYPDKPSRLLSNFVLPDITMASLYKIEYAFYDAVYIVEVLNKEQQVHRGHINTMYLQEGQLLSQMPQLAHDYWQGKPPVSDKMPPLLELVVQSPLKIIERMAF